MRLHAGCCVYCAFGRLERHPSGSLLHDAALISPRRRLQQIYLPVLYTPAWGAAHATLHASAAAATVDFAPAAVATHADGRMRDASSYSCHRQTPSSSQHRRLHASAVSLLRHRLHASSRQAQQGCAPCCGRFTRVSFPPFAPATLNRDRPPATALLLLLPTSRAAPSSYARLGGFLPVAPFLQHVVWWLVSCRQVATAGGWSCPAGPQAHAPGKSLVAEAHPANPGGSSGVTSAMSWGTLQGTAA
eukprot:GHRQ01004472.1.p1 GENE.GHRQ01004472.1~~GHRQ01004472.1.p1  ORF type:complete len:246 (+),score=0.01 GHRQ01004472.1:343-1080(+)